MWYQFGEENVLADTNQESAVPVVRTDELINLCLRMVSLAWFLQSSYNMILSSVARAKLDDKKRAQKQKQVQRQMQTYNKTQNQNQN